MTTLISVGDLSTTTTGSGIHRPKHIRSLTQGLVPPSTSFQTVVMDIYTGTCVFDFKSGDLQVGDLVSLVPLGLHNGTGPNVDIQGYPGDATAVISASMTSFDEDPTGAGVDGAFVRLEQQSFPGFLPAKVLVIRAEIGVEDGNLHRLAYQVTVLATGAQDLPNMILNVVPNQQVPQP
jgi:hypothetical protein